MKDGYFYWSYIKDGQERVIPRMWFVITYMVVIYTSPVILNIFVADHKWYFRLVYLGIWFLLFLWTRKLVLQDAK